MGKSLLILAGVLALSAAAGALPFPGLDNELVNPGFEQQGEPWYGWQHGADLGIGPATGHGYAAYCKDPEGDLLLRQVIDESRFNGWDPLGNAKIVDLTLDVLLQDLSPEPTSGVKFRFDWWTYTGDQPPTSPPDGYSEWKTVLFSDIPDYQPNTWLTVNPYNRDATIFARFQPRWISFEAVLLQGAGETVWVDNFNLTAKCVPEPSVVMMMMSGFGALGAVRRFRKR